MSLEHALSLVLPKKEINGDCFEFVRRDRVFDELSGLITPIKHRFALYEHDGSINPALRGTTEDEVRAGRARVIADLNTEAGREAWLECWWPQASDGFCLTSRVEHGLDEAGLPYPICTLLRRASLRHRLGPDMIFDAMRLGTTSLYTTVGRALWDCGIRRSLWHPTPAFDAWLKGQVGGLSPRLTPLDPNDPLCSFACLPGPPQRVSVAYILNFPDRPITDNAMDWLRGTP